MFTKLEIKQDGDNVCVMYGEGLGEGIAGFGETEEEAMIEFCFEFLAKNKRKQQDEKKKLEMKIDNVQLLETGREYQEIILGVDDRRLEMEVSELKNIRVLIDAYFKNFNNDKQ